MALIKYGVDYSALPMEERDAFLRLMDERTWTGFEIDMKSLSYGEFFILDHQPVEELGIPDCCKIFRLS